MHLHETNMKDVMLKIEQPNPCQTIRFVDASVTHKLQSLYNLSATYNFHRSQRLQQGPRSVSARLQSSRRLVGEIAATKLGAAMWLSMFKNLVVTYLVADNPGEVVDQSPIIGDHRLLISE